MAGQKSYFGKGDIRPNLPGVKQPDNPADPNVSARNSLRSLENAANRKNALGNTASLLENQPPSRSLYTGKGRPNRGEISKSNRLGKGGLGKKLLRAGLLKATPLLVIVLILAGGMFLIFGSSSFLGAHLEALFTEATSTDYTAYTMRSNEIFKEILAGQIPMNDYLRERLENEDIEVHGNTLVYDGITINAGNFDTVYNGNVHFREALTYARRGRIAMFFDDIADSFYTKLGMSRDVFHNYSVTGNQEADDSSYDGLMTGYFGGGSSMAVNTAEEVEKEDDKGNKYIDYEATGEDVSSAGGGDAESEARAKAYMDAIGDKVAARTPGCAALEIGNMVATAVASNERYTSAHDYMTKMESLSKSRQGEGDNSAVHSVLNWFTKSEPSTVYDATTGEKTTVVGSPLEAEGMRVILGGLTANRSNAKKFSLERSYESTNISVANSGLSTALCNVERATHTLISLSALAVAGGPLVKATIGILLDVPLELGVKVVASTVLSLLIPTVAQVIFRNPFPEAVGIAGGEYFTEGASNINMLSAQQNSGATGAGKDQVLAYNHATNVILAQEAEIDRATHSPFDANNRNTFLGSIVSSILPLATSSSSLISSAGTLTSVTGSSIAMLNPTYADGENTSLMTNFGHYCDKTSEISATGNIYCTMIATHDLSVINTPEDDEEYRSIIELSVEKDGDKEIIKDGSPLAHFIAYWMKRYSMPGIYDANIANACKNDSRHIPILSNIVDMVKSLMGDDYCKSVADGSRFINSPDNPAWEEMEKWHQLYVISARVKNNLGVYGDEDNPVTTFAKKYDEEHPLDNSRSGYLARISGMTKDEAEDVIAAVDYLQKIANYNPSARYSFLDGNPSNQFTILASKLSDNINSSAEAEAIAILPKEVQYAYQAQGVTA